MVNNQSGVQALSLLDVVPEYEPYAFVVFTGSDEPKWFQRLVHKDFRHCFVIYWDGSLWYKIERTYGFLDVRVISLLDNFFVGRYNIKRYYDAIGHTTVEIDLSNRNDKQIIQYFGINNCVQTVKDWIGINKWSIVTPYQLYKYLLGE